MKTFTRRKAGKKPAKKAARRPTVVTVAKRAGVSIASVSRVLNGLPASPRMARRVRAATAALDYVPDLRGRSLKAGRTMQLAFAVADIANPVYIEMMRAIDELTKAAGFRLVLHSTGSDPANEIDLIEGLGRRYADGLILSPLRITPDHLRALRAAQVPIVIIGSLPDDEPLDSVRADSRRGVGLAIEHLFAAGRRSIAFVNGDPRTVPGTARQEGYRAALAVAGLRYDERLEIDGGEFTYAAGVGAARRPAVLPAAGAHTGGALQRAAARRGHLPRLHRREGGAQRRPRADVPRQLHPAAEQRPVLAVLPDRDHLGVHDDIPPVHPRAQ